MLILLKGLSLCSKYNQILEQDYANYLTYAESPFHFGPGRVHFLALKKPERRKKVENSHSAN